MPLKISLNSRNSKVLKESKSTGSSLKKFGGFSLKSNKAIPLNKKNEAKSAKGKLAKSHGLLGKQDDDDDDNEKIVTIRSYDHQAEEEAKLQKTSAKLVINPPASRKLTPAEILQQQQQQQTNSKNDDFDENLHYGINLAENTKRADSDYTDERRDLSLLSNKDKTPHQSRQRLSEAKNVEADTAGQGADNPTLESYQRVPVEQFGAAFLRGLGWKDEEDKNKGKDKREAENDYDSSGDGDAKKNAVADRIRNSVQRQEFLGIGAKPVPMPVTGIGNGTSRGKKREIMRYTPVVMRDKETGKIINEKELNQRQG